MKNWLKPTGVEWLSFLAMMPLVSILLNYVLFRSRLWTDSEVWMYSCTLVFALGFLMWYLHIAVMHWLRKIFAPLHQTTLRLVILAAAHISMSFFTFLGLIQIYEITGFLHFEYSNFKVQLSLLIAVGLTMIATTMWEADYTFKQWKKAADEKEMLQQLSLQNEFNTLKSQVNPHFLFNCFNTLSSLITEDKKAAEVFLNELSKVYRYLLKNNQNTLSSLKDEVSFVESYYRLLKTRHGEAVEIKIDIDPKYKEYLLPSLTLQLLIENAVKHNALSKNKPLTIDIFSTAGNRLVVNNNLQKRSTKNTSHGIGLKNIYHRYKLLNQRGFQVLEDRKSFSVVLPLIWNKVEAKTVVNQFN